MSFFKKYKTVVKILYIFATVFILFLFLKFLPWSALEKFMHKQYSSRFYDKNGELIYILPLQDGLRREFTPLSSIPKELVQMFIEQEDKNFYYHLGVDLPAIFRALKQNRQSKRIVSGASTITMQLARLVYPRKSSPTIKDKIFEILTAFRLEIKLSKKQLLELYMNNIPFGFQIEGVTSAARSFYGVELAELSEDRIQTLSKIPRRPSEYAPAKSFVYPLKCRHFIEYVKKQFSENNEIIPFELNLSIDAKLTEIAEKKIQEKLEQSKSSRIRNGSALVINNHTGQILVWVGNASFEDFENAGQIDGVIVKNQPGSAMKPFLYAYALEKGFSANTVLPDIQSDFGSKKVYVPLNFNNRYNGPVRFRVSLASSLNIPAVYLLYNIGIDSYMNILSKLGFKSLNGTRETTGLSLALGSSEVTLEEMTRAFSVFTGDGNVLNSSSFLATSRSKKHRVYKTDTARIMCSILGDKNSRELGFGHSKVFDTPYPCIFKTGTSNQFQNIIALASTSEYTAGAWMGNFAGETVIRKTGSSIPAEITRSLLDILQTENSYKEFQKPEGYTLKKICTLSGLSPCPSCPSWTYEYIKKSRKNLKICNWHYEEDGRIKIFYPTEYQHWANGKNILGEKASSQIPLAITYPKNNAVFFYDSSLPENVQMLAIHAIGGSRNSAKLYLDENYVGQTENDVFAWTVPLTRGKHSIKILCGTESAEIFFEVR